MKNKPYPYYDVPEIKNLQEMVSYCAEVYNTKTAFHYLNKSREITVSYKSFFEDVAALCNYFIKCGYNRTHIALLGENSYEWLVSFFAIVNSNNVVIPLDKELDAKDINKLIIRSDSTVLIHSDNYTDEAEYNKQIKLINMKKLAKIISDNKTDICTDLSFYKSIKIDDNAMCAVFYTSGTTSEPKGVMLSHKNIALDAVYTNMNSTVPDSSILVLPLHHTYSTILAISVPMLVGSSVFINKNMRTLMSDILFCKPKYIAVVPLMLEIFYKKITEGLKSNGKEETIRKLVKISNFSNKLGIDLRKKFFSKIIEAFGGRLELLAVGGAPINPNTVKALTEFGIQVLSGYGTTECSPIVSSVRNRHYKPDSVGYVIPNVKARIVDGEIQISGDIVFSGYYKDQTATEAVFDGEWYKTGDLGSIENGFLFIKGRCKNLIVLSNGENISPEGIEAVLQENIPDIEEVLVYCENDKIVADIYISSLSAELKGDIIKAVDMINKSFPSYKQISNIFFREKEFEKTTTKKIKRNYK